VVDAATVLNTTNNRPFVVPEVADTAMGSAVLAATGRLYLDLKSVAQAMVHNKTVVVPETAWVPVYEEHYVRFKEELGPSCHMRHRPAKYSYRPNNSACRP
jgi:sugar (pentulose or hexulose) kinase